MIWLLKLKKPFWDTMTSCVVRAPNEEKARKLASEKSYGEGPEVWLDSKETSCDAVDAYGGEDKIICTAYAS